MDNTYVHLVSNGQYTQLNNGTALASSTTLTDISPGGNTFGQAFQFNADQLQVGQRYRLHAHGIVSNTGTPNLTLGVYYGGVAGTALATTGAVATASGLSSTPWHLELKFQVVSVGTSGSIQALGWVIGPYASFAMLPATAAGGNVVGSLDTSTAKLVTVGATWGTSSASNTITCDFFGVERMNEGGS
jgi:hypothetical protein